MPEAREFKSPLSQGATRKVFKPKAIKRRANIKPFVGFLVIAGFVFSLYHYWPVVSSVIDRPVGSVAIKGSFYYVERAEIERLVLEAVEAQAVNINDDFNSSGESFFLLDLQNLQESLEKNSWIDRVQVSRRWPDQLQIKIIEQKPIARWGNIGFLNYRGELIVAEKRPELMLLPLLNGAEGGERKVMAQYQFMVPLLRSRDLSVKRLQRLPRGAWVLQLGFEDIEKNGASITTFDVTLGRDQIVEKVQRLLLVYDQQLQGQRQRIDKIDLRYNNGIAVSWRIENNNIDMQLDVGKQG